MVEARWECGRRGRVCRAGGERERRRLRDRPPSLESGQSGSVGGLWGASRGAAWGGRSPVVHGAPSAIGWWPGGYGPHAVPPGGGGPPSSMGPLRPSDGGRGGTAGTGVVVGTGGVAPGGRWGMRAGRSVAAIPSAGAVRVRGVVARWGRAVGSGSGGGGVGSGGGGAAGGGGVGSGGVGVAGMAHGVLVGFPVPLVGVGHWASWAVPGAALCGGHGGRVGGRA